MLKRNYLSLTYATNTMFQDGHLVKVQSIAFKRVVSKCLVSVCKYFHSNVFLVVECYISDKSITLYKNKTCLKMKGVLVRLQLFSEYFKQACAKNVEFFGVSLGTTSVGGKDEQLNCLRKMNLYCLNKNVYKVS